MLTCFRPEILIIKLTIKLATNITTENEILNEDTHFHEMESVVSKLKIIKHQGLMKFKMKCIKLEL